jgi:hypothetical protein
MEAVVEARPVMAEPEVLPEVVAEVVPEIMENEVEAAPVWHEQQPVVELGNVGTSSSEHIDQVLSRLELINLELKLHLDNIDSRVSRLEPHIEELASQVVRSLGLAAAAEAAGKVPVAEPRWVREEPVVQAASVPAVPVVEGAAASEPRVSDDVWPAVDWVGKARSLRGAGMALGVAACLALVIWLWERPPAQAGEVTPVAASTAAVGTAAASKVEPAKPAAIGAAAAKERSLNAVKEEVQAEIAATINKAAAADDPEASKTDDTIAANVARDGVGKAPLKTRGGTGVKGEGDYAAPPWTKWYVGAPQGSKTVQKSDGAVKGAPRQ